MAVTPKHPQQVKTAIAKAASDGLKPPSIARRLSEGRLPGYPFRYEMPISTARYYYNQALRRAASSRITELAGGDPSHAVDQLARQLLSEAELGIKETREGKTRDPEKVKRWADVLRVLAPLVRPDNPSGNNTKGKAKAKPQDPLTARLTASANPSPHLEDTQGRKEEEGASAPTKHANGTPHHNTATAGYPHGPQSATSSGRFNGEGAVLP